MSRPVFIYTLSDPRYNLLCYVGKTDNLKTRLIQHVKDGQRHTAKKYIHIPITSSKSNWMAFMLQLGIDVQMDCIEEVQQRHKNYQIDVDDRESYWIAYMYAQGHPLTNSQKPPQKYLDALNTLAYNPYVYCPYTPIIEALNEL